MDLKKAAKCLKSLIDEKEDNLIKYAKVSALLEGFEAENRNIDGSMIDNYADEKINKVRGWFCMLCGIGEDGYTPEKIRENLKNDIFALGGIISSDGLTLKPSLK